MKLPSSLARNTRIIGVVTLVRWPVWSWGWSWWICTRCPVPPMSFLVEVKLARVRYRFNNPSISFSFICRSVSYESRFQWKSTSYCLGSNSTCTEKGSVTGQPPRGKESRENCLREIEKGPIPGGISPGSQPGGRKPPPPGCKLHPERRGNPAVG